MWINNANDIECKNVLFVAFWVGIVLTVVQVFLIEMYKNEPLIYIFF